MSYWSSATSIRYAQSTPLRPGCGRPLEDATQRGCRLPACLLGLLWLFTLVVPAMADDLAGSIHNRLGDPEVVRGEFEQRKFLEGLSKPLVSTGEFLVVKGRGMIWRTQTPFAQTLRLTRTRIVQEQGGQARFMLSADQGPAFAAVSQTLLPLFEADFRQMERQFHISGEMKGEGWYAVLRPIPTPLAQIFRHIRLEGARHVQQVELVETNGDRTEIRLSRVRTGGDLTPVERRLLE